MKNCKKGGGAIVGGRGSKEEDKEVEDKKDGFKHGGKVKKKHGGKVGGKHPMGRPDKKSRGGAADMQRMPKLKDGASNPLSGAGSTAEPAISKNDKEDD